MQSGSGSWACKPKFPPMYSALKRDGQPLYKLARAGVEVERAPREIELFELGVLGFSADQIEFETVCSKGTYIRVLSEDIAKALGTCGHVTALRRVHVEPFGAEPMETLESVIQAREQGTWPRVLPADWPLEHLPKVSLDGARGQPYSAWSGGVHRRGPDELSDRDSRAGPPLR